MKKVFTLILSVMMLTSISLSAFAAGSFVSSPSGNPAPTVDSVEHDSDDCTATVVVTAYSQRDTLESADKTALESAYSSIKGTDDITTLNSSLKAAASQAGIKGSELQVSDLFDLEIVNCDTEHASHGFITVTLNAETLDNFFALLHYENGAWTMVNATAEGDKLTFKIDSASPYAIVVDTTPDSPGTSDNVSLYIFGAAAVLALVGAAVFFTKSRKASAN